MRLPALLVAALCSILGSTASHATTISFEAMDLADPVPGEDLWEYSYEVGDFTFDTDYGFTILFDFTSYTLIEDPPPAVNGDWDVISIQPDLLLPDAGAYDALALVNAASLADPFAVTFVWLGAGTPGSQPFVVYEPGFSTIEIGQTVPEPANGLLFCLGLIALLGARSRLGSTGWGILRIPIRGARTRLGQRS